METRSRVSEATIEVLVRHIVEAVRPRRIVLFGSAARGQMGPESDLDLLVVMPDGIRHHPGLEEPVTRQEYEDPLILAERVVDWAATLIEKRVV